MRLEAGALVTDKVRLLHPLREGGMGTVWVGEHVTLETKVAVKFVSAELARRSENAVERFKREAKAAAKLKSPYVVTMLDHGVSDDGIPYIVMELLEGETLSERLARVGKIARADVAAVVTQAAKALEEAHAMGIVHRDIKPSNLFLAKSGEDIFVKVLDFGIAKAMESSGAQLTLTEGMVGTLSYMSPEQMSDASAVGPAADLWSVAVVAYQALTGALPFDATSAVLLHKQIVAETFKLPSQRLGPDAAPLDDWFRRALAADPADRFKSARELSTALRRAVGDAPSDETRRSDAGSDAGPPPNASAEMGTAEFLAKSGTTTSSDGPDENEQRKPAAQSSSPPAGAPTMSGHETAPPSGAKRRSMMQGIVLGGAFVAIVAVALVAGRSDRATGSGLQATGSGAAATSSAPSAGSARDARAAATTSSGAQPAARSPEPSASALKSAEAAPSSDPFPQHKVWPIGCTAPNRPCGIGCCMWDRGCEPGSCEEPLPAGEWDVRLAVATVWQGKDEGQKKPLKDADVWVRFGKDGVRKSLFYDRPIRATTADLGQLITAWIQPNAPWLPPLIELPPIGLLHGPSSLVLCRGMHLKHEDHGYTYWLWLSVSPAGEKAPEPCAKSK